mmetsp:Transcript_1487/g.3355  ORF Transcript_1487/g.3355 Transcript_1487/m.3355 type:complete len:486 (+) Transcript_1487:154-1611(+)
MSTDNRWLGSDIVKLVIIGAQIAASIEQTIYTSKLQDLGSNPKFYLNIAIFFSLVLFWVWSLGAHEPAYFGWEAYIALRGLSNSSITFIGLYVTFLLAKANYVSSTMQARIPFWAGPAYVTVTTLTLTIQLVGIIVVVVTDSGPLNAITNIANVIAVSFGGTYMAYSSFSLRKGINKLLDKKLQSLKSHSNGVPGSSTLNEATGERYRGSAYQPPPQSARATKKKRTNSANSSTLPKLTNHGSGGKFATIGGKANSNKKGDAFALFSRPPGGSDSGYHTQQQKSKPAIDPQESIDEKNLAAPQSPAKNSRSKSVGTRGTTVVGKDVKKLKSLLKRITIFGTLIPLLALILVVAFVLAIDANLSGPRTTSEDIDDVAENYDLLRDLTSYLTIVLFLVFQFYAHKNGCKTLVKPIKNLFKSCFQSEGSGKRGRLQSDAMNTSGTAGVDNEQKLGIDSKSTHIGNMKAISLDSPRISKTPFKAGAVHV